LAGLRFFATKKALAPKKHETLYGGSDPESMINDGLAWEEWEGLSGLEPE
jgi:hypothetical protein